VFAPLIAAILPFILWPIEYFLPYPHLIEELAKAALVYYLAKELTGSHLIKEALIIGFVFSITETVLFLLNILPTGDSTTLALRLLMTTPLHILTTLIIAIPTAINKKFLPFGLLGAILVHYFFNFFVGGN
jgi:RsiW-degrading membrane proteinase PrsW (M82 family)